MLVFWQSLSVSKRISFLVLLFLLVSIPAGVYLAQKTQIFKPKASSGPVDFYGTQVSFLKLFGQKSIGETSPGKITANGTFHTSGVVVDRSSTPNKVYVVDTGNNRILGFNGIDGDGTKPADMVFGQPSFTTGSCNGDNNLGINKAPTASTLCLIGYPYITNLGEYWMRANFDVDGQGNLYVVDVWNNRVLKYNQPYSADKSDGKGDNIADFVWGQDDFTSNGINKSSSSYYTSATPGPDKTSLWTSFGFGTTDHVASRGVSVDQQGNIWIADSFNHRVLRFPPNSKESDLVLGQPDFTSNINECSSGPTSNAINAPFDKMCTPTLAIVDPATGQVYVLDEHPPGFRARILVFNSELRNGVTAGRVIAPEGSVTGFIFNTFKTGDYANGKLWVNEHGLSRTVLIDDHGTIIKVIGTLGLNYIGGEHTIPSACGANSDFAKKNLWTGGGILDLWTPGGSIGFDNDNNIYLAEDITGRVMRYALPYDPRTVNGQTCLPEPNGGLFPVKGPGILGPNIRSDDALSGGIGVVAFGNQLIIENAGFRVWNNYLDKEVGSAPDIVVPSAGNSRKLISDAIDDSNRLWVFDSNGKITVYQLPFETGSENRPLASSVRLYWEDTGEEINYNSGLGNGIAFDKFNRKIYVIDSLNHRVLRISNYNVLFDSDPNNDKLLVDEVIGQIDKSTTGCNFYQQGVRWAYTVTGTRSDGLCIPHQVKFDKLGNLYVVENDYECQGNDRITLFTAEDLKNAQGLFPRLQAKKVFVGSLTGPGPCAYGTVGQPGSPVAIAFDSKNQMVVGNDGYYGTNEDRHLKQLWLYSDPLTRQTPDAYINLPMGASGELAFDTQDNLIAQDHTWSKVWVVNLDRDPALVKWLRTVPTPSPVPSPSPYPSPSPTATPTFTPTPTLTPSPVPSPTSTPPPPSPIPSLAPTPSPIPSPSPSPISYSLPINYSWTMVGLPVDKTGEYRAEDFLREINSSMPTSESDPYPVIKIYRYDAQTQTWQSHNIGGSENNFSIIPGEGYFILSKVAGNATILGFRRTTNTSIIISNGWSLISVYTNRPGLTGDSLLREMRNQGIDARYFARWNGTSYQIIPYTDINNFTIRPGGGFWIYNAGQTKTFQSIP